MNLRYSNNLYKTMVGNDVNTPGGACVCPPMYPPQAEGYLQQSMFTGPRILPTKYGVNSVAFSPTGEYLAAGTYFGDVYIWNMRIQEGPRVLRVRSGVWSVAFSPTGDTLAVGAENREVYIVDTIRGNALGKLRVSGRAVSVTYSPRGDYLAAGSSFKGRVPKLEPEDRRSHLYIWNTTTWESSISALEKEFTSVTYSPDGQHLAVGFYDGNVHIWDTRTWREFKILPVGGVVFSVAYSSRGDYLAAGSEDGNVHVWNTRTWEESILQVGSIVSSVAYSSDGDYLAAGSRDGEVHIWNMRRGREHSILQAGGAVNSVAFRPTGDLAAGLNGGVRLWQRA